MANVANIQILRSYANTAPTSLLDGQLAYSFVSNTLFIGSNTGVITIGDPSTKQVAQSAYNQANSANILAQAAYNQANNAPNVVSKLVNGTANVRLINSAVPVLYMPTSSVIQGNSALTLRSGNTSTTSSEIQINPGSFSIVSTDQTNPALSSSAGLTASGATGNPNFEITINDPSAPTSQNWAFDKLGILSLPSGASLYDTPNQSITFGYNAYAAETQGSYSVAIGNFSGAVNQGDSAVSIGNNAGDTNQGAYSIAIGNQAGTTNQNSQSIILNANTTGLNANNSGFFVNPVRNDTANITQSVFYNTTTKELTYALTPSGGQAAFDKANSANILAQAAFDAANAAGSSALTQAAFNKANSANVLAQSSYDFANTVNTFSYSSYAQANASSFLGQSAYNKANSANVLAQAAYDAANAAGSSALTQAAFDKANSANVLAQSSYNFANTVNTYSYSSNVFLQNSISSTNTAMKSYVDQANTGMASYVVSSNSAMKSYVDQANTGLKSYGDQTYFGKSGGTISGSVTIQNNLTVNGNVTYTGNVTSVQISGNTGQFFGYTANGFNALYAGIPTGYLIEPQMITQFTANYNGYAGVNHQNINSGANSSSDVFLTADNGTLNDGFVDLGIGSSTYNYPGYSLIGPNDGYLFATGNTTTGGGKMIIGTGLNNDVVFATGGLNTTNEVMRVTSANTVVIKSPIATTNTTTGALQVTGGISTQNDVQASNVYSQGTNLLNYANTISTNTVSLQSNVVYLLGNTSPNLYNTTISSGVSSIAVGGAPVQTAGVWKTYTMVQVIDAILFPTLGPTYTIPTITLTANNTGTLEIGQTINQSLTVTGTKNDAGAFTQLRINRNTINLTANNSPPATPVANISAQYGYADPNNQNYSYANTYIDSNTVVSGATTWTGYGNYSAGLAKQTNKGTTDSNAFAVLTTTGPQSANATNFATTSATITGIYPYFWGVSSTQPTAASIATAIQAGTATKVLAVGSGTLTITYNASSQYIWLAVQTGYAAKTIWYNTALNNGTIGAGQFILGGVSQAVTSPSAYWSGVTFNIYISGYATTTSGSIQFS